MPSKTRERLVERHQHVVGDLLRGRHRVRGVAAEQEHFAARRDQILSGPVRIRQLVLGDDQAPDRAAHRDVVARVRHVVDPQVAPERLDDAAGAFVAAQHPGDARGELTGRVGSHPIA
jgi:hypothetical protein